MRMPPRNFLKGFTLIELAVVLIIIALLASGSIAMIIATLNRAGYSRTNEKLDVIQQTLLNFAKTNGYLPCPADITQSPATSAMYGVGAGSGSLTPNCSAVNFTQGNTVAGLLPVRMLSLDDSYALDGFNRPWLYVMDSRLSVANAANLYPMGSNVGSITIKDDAGGTRTSNAIYTLISFGADGHGAFSPNGGTARRNTHAINTNELQNCHCDTNATATAFDSTFIQMKESGDINQNLSNFFDHTVRFAQLFDFTGSGTVAGSSGSSTGGSSSGGSSSGGSSSGSSSSGGSSSGSSSSGSSSSGSSSSGSSSSGGSSSGSSSSGSSSSGGAAGSSSSGGGCTCEYSGPTNALDCQSGCSTIPGDTNFAWCGIGCPNPCECSGNIASCPAPGPNGWSLETYHCPSSSSSSSSGSGSSATSSSSSSSSGSGSSATSSSSSSSSGSGSSR